MTVPFPAHTLETAPEEVRGAMDTMQKNFGFIFSMFATFAEAPTLLMAHQAAAGFFDKASLSSAERLVVVMTTSHLHDCDFSMTAHSWFARRQGIDEGLLASLRTGQPLSDPRLEALRRFVTAMVAKRGAVSDSDKDAFFAAGFGARQSLEVVLLVAHKTMSIYTNALAGTPPNPEFGDAVWHGRS
jgi:alkylhydroperoxidase family enzyme